jgi:hypothetical protein
MKCASLHDLSLLNSPSVLTKSNLPKTKKRVKLRVPSQPLPFHLLLRSPKRFKRDTSLKTSIHMEKITGPINIIFSV